MQLCSHLSRALLRPARLRLGDGMAAAAHSAAAPLAAPKAALLIIGDEILQGSIADANTPWLAKLLYSRGVDLVRVECVPDDKADIIETVHRLRRRVGDSGFVFTSGGIGPTHDDVTYEALAEAFGRKLERHAPTVALMEPHYKARNMELNEARLRMAALPAPADAVLFTPGLWVPLVVLERVHVLPGIPRLFQAMVGAHQDRFQGPLSSSQVLYTHMGEGDLADPLAEVAKAHPGVSIGSYPNTAAAAGEGGGAYKVKLAFSSRDAAALAAAVGAARGALPGLFEAGGGAAAPE
ncbi:MAG: MoaB/Mog domain-containing protein [Monoraphidium minutum]|nr:MAG: MoaB/Mog domain-containing protein [Monoraphidium minutum]